MKISKQTAQLLKAALKEDIGSGDKTAKLLVPSKAQAQALVLARQKGIFCGRKVADSLARQVDPKLTLKWKIKEGQAFSKNQKLLIIRGSLRSILSLERTLLNFLGHLSGISTQTNLYVQKVKKSKVTILDTRKTTPLWRELEKYAVRTGGGKNHRFGLDDEVFIKENHRGYDQFHKLKKIPRKFVIEVRNQKELQEALSLKPRVILFDNFSPATLKKAVMLAKKQDKHVRFEASGGITLRNIASYAKTGVHQISVGALTHSVQTANFSMVIS